LNYNTNPSLARELSSRWQYNNHINSNIAYRIQKTTELAGFSGDVHIGNRIGYRPPSEAVSDPGWFATLSLIHKEGDDWEREPLDDTELDRLVTFMEELGLEE
jgi:hypothetical protein